MRVEILNESGIKEALFGIGLSYGDTTGIYYCSTIGLSVHDLDQKLHDKLYARATELARRGGGHDKFLRQICVWLDVNAPLYWWEQFDTYKVGAVSQSESIMYTLMKYKINENFFESLIPEATLARLKALQEEKDFYTLTNELPRGYILRRIVSCNYAVLRNIIKQHEWDKQPEWKQFICRVMNGVGYPELLE